MTAARETVAGVSIPRYARHPRVRQHRLIAMAIALVCLSHPPDTSAQEADAQPPPTSPTATESAGLAELRGRANAGDADSQRELGIAYDLGMGVLQDHALAAEWYLKAAEQGDPAAQYNLGVAYDTGHGVPQDFVESARWYRKAAEQGDVGALHNLGVAYALGQGVLQDYVEACKWLQIGSMLASGEIRTRNDMTLAVVLTKMTATQVAEGQKRASEWLKAFAKRRVAIAATDVEAAC